MSLLLCSCAAEKPNISNQPSDKEQISIQTSVSDCTDENKMKEEASENITCDEDQISNDNTSSYQIYTDVIYSEEIYNIQNINLPAEINGFSYYVYGLKNDRIVVSLNKEENSGGYTGEYGLYDPSSDSYEKIASDLFNCIMIGSYNNLYFLNFIINENNSSLQMFNSDTNKFITLYNSTEGRYLHSNEVAVYDGKCYFDAYTSSDRDNCIIYEYDIESDELVIFAENAMSPKVNNNNLWYLSYDSKTKVVEKFINHTTGASFENHDNLLIKTIYSNNSIFTVTNKNIGSMDSFYVLKENSSDGDDRLILATIPGEGEILEQFQVNNFCIGWYEVTGEASTPCVYDINSKKTVLFREIPNCHYQTFLDDNSGLIMDPYDFKKNHQIWLFKPKEGVSN